MAKRITITLTDEQHAFLKADAETQNRTIAGNIVNTLDHYMRHYGFREGQGDDYRTWMPRLSRLNKSGRKLSLLCAA